MPEVVDSIIAELIGRDNNYIATFDRATAAHERFTKSTPKVDGLAALSAGAKQYADQHGKAVGDAARAETQAAAQISKARKSVSDATKASAAAAKAAAKEQTDAAKAAAQAELAFYAQGPKIFEAKARQYAVTAKAADAAAEKQAAAAKKVADAEAAAARAIAEAEARRDAAAARRVIAEPGAGAGARPGTGSLFGRQVPREATGQASANLGSTSAEVAVETEVNHLLADRFDLTQRARAAEGAVKRELQDEVAYLARINAYRRAGLTDEQAVLRAERESAAIQALRAEASPKGSANGSRGFRQALEGATLGYSAPLGTLAGIGVAATIGTAVALTKAGLDYAKSLKDQSAQLNITTRDLQVYRAAAAETGVTNEQLTTAFGQLSSNLGRAQEGSDQQRRIFKALNVDIGDAKSGFKSLSDILPTILQRFSQISDPAKRAAVETALFGESGRRLDALLSGGPEKVNELAAALERTGSILSDKDIQQADATAVKLERLKNQLEVDLSRTVANNTSNILLLATAFAKLAESVLGAVGAMLRFGAISTVNSPLASAAQRQGSYDMLMQDHAGRTLLARRNAVALNELDRADKNPGTGLNGDILGNSVAGDIADNPQARYQAYLKLSGERRRILAADRADAAAQAAGAAPQGGTVGDLSKIFAPKGPKGKTEETLRKEAAARQRAYEDQLAQSQEAELRAREQMSGDVTKQAEIESDLVQRALDRKIGYVDSTGKQHKGDIQLEADAKRIDESRVAELEAAARAAAAAEKQAIALETSSKLAEIDAQHAQTTHDIQGDLLNSQLALAQTAKERLAIQLRILENDKQNERRLLQDRLAGLKPDDAAGRADVNAKLGSLNARYAGQEASARVQDAGPLNSYLRSLPDTADKLNEAFENVAVDGLQHLTDGITDAITGAKNLGQAFSEVSKQIIADLLKIGIERSIVLPLADALFPRTGASSGGGASGIGDFLSTAAKFIGIGGARAAGGNVVAGVPYRVGERGEELFVPSQSGAIVPNNGAISGAGGSTTIIHQSFNLDARYGITTPQLLQYVNDTAAEKAAQAGAAAVRVAGGQVPGIIQRKQQLGN